MPKFLSHLLTLFMVVAASTSTSINNSSVTHLITTVEKSPIILKVLTVYTNEDGHVEYSGHFWLISVYKGALQIAHFLHVSNNDKVAIYNIHDRKVNVSGFYNRSTIGEKTITSQKYYILFVEINNSNHLTAFKECETCTSFLEWTEENENIVWNAMGWADWMDWAPCTTSCGEGIQERWRHCKRETCIGYNKERRRCNMFPCQSTLLEPLESLDDKYFHPSKSAWEKVPGRSTAWRVKSSYYLWLPASEAAIPVAEIKPSFTLVVSIRIQPAIKLARTEGTVFTLRSESNANSITLKVDGPDALRLIYGGPKGTQSVAIAAKIADGRWHQLSLGIQDQVSVRSYLDCRWVSTDVLRGTSFRHISDVDLVTGYFFTGEIEHLMLVPDSRAVLQQCSNTKISLLDEVLLKSDKFSLHQSEVPMTKTFGIMMDVSDDDDGTQDDDDEHEIGSGTGPISNAEWSSWSNCSTSCGPGVQMRRLECVTNRSLCPAGYGEHKIESRFCNLKPCHKEGRRRNQKEEDDISHRLRRRGRLIKTDACHPKCENAGYCFEGNKCLCRPGTSGIRCEKDLCNGECPINGGGGDRNAVCVGNGLCKCPPAATGLNCGDPVCNPPCPFGSLCAPENVCLCDENVTDERCARKRCKYVTIRKPFTMGIRKFSKGAACAQDNKCVTRLLPKYQTVYRTVYRTTYECQP